VNQESL
jgi:hypothetical protein